MRGSKRPAAGKVFPFPRLSFAAVKIGSGEGPRRRRDLVAPAAQAPDQGTRPVGEDMGVEVVEEVLRVVDDAVDAAEDAVVFFCLRAVARASRRQSAGSTPPGLLRPRRARSRQHLAVVAEEDGFHGEAPFRALSPCGAEGRGGGVALRATTALEKPSSAQGRSWPRRRAPSPSPRPGPACSRSAPCTPLVRQQAVPGHQGDRPHRGVDRWPGPCAGWAVISAPTPTRTPATTARRTGAESRPSSRASVHDVANPAKDGAGQQGLCLRAEEERKPRRGHARDHQVKENPSDRHRGALPSTGTAPGPRPRPPRWPRP